MSLLRLLKKVGANDMTFAPTWRSRRDSNSRAVLAATRFPIVLVMTTSILLHIYFSCRFNIAAAEIIITDI